MKKLLYFDYKSLAKKMGMSDLTLKKIEKETKKEFPHDTMMFELHVLRAIRSKGLSQINFYVFVSPLQTKPKPKSKTGKY